MEITRHWRLKPQRYQLVGKVCPECGTKTFPPRDVCPTCVDNNLKIGVGFSNQMLIWTTFYLAVNETTSVGEAG